MPDSFSFTKEHAKKLDDIYLAITGDPYDPENKPGIVKMVITHDKELYGDKSKIPNTVGLADRHNQLETSFGKVIFKIGFVLSMITATLVGLAKLLEIYVAYKK